MVRAIVLLEKSTPTHQVVQAELPLAGRTVFAVLLARQFSTFRAYDEAFAVVYLVHVTIAEVIRNHPVGCRLENAPVDPVACLERRCNERDVL